MVDIILILLGIIIFVGGLYFLIKDNKDMQSRNIYIITTLVGAVIIAYMLVKILFLK